MPAKKKKSIDTKKVLVRGLIALSVVLNVILIIGVLAAASFIKSEQSSYSMLSYFTSSKLDEKGCLITRPNEQLIAQYGEGANICVYSVVASPDGTILAPDTLKGQRYLPKQ